MWLVALLTYFFNIANFENFVYASFSILYLILMNPPLLGILKKIKKNTFAEFFTYVISLMEIIGITAVIHSFGGIQASFLLPIYAASIIYVGPLESRKKPYIIAAFINICFALLLTLERTGILQTIKVNPGFDMSWKYRVAIMIAVAPMFFTIAFVSSYMVQLLKRSSERLQEQNEELRLALLKAGESEKIKSEFLTNISHELRTSLHAIIGFPDLLANHHFGELNEKQIDCIKDINVSGRQLLSLINSLLDISKMEAGKMDIDILEINLKTLLENSLNISTKLAERNGIMLPTDIGDCPEMIQADESMIRQTVYNLLSNAIKFTPEGGLIKLSACPLSRLDGRWTTKEGEALSLPIGKEHSASHKHWEKISVKDTGIGLKKENKQIIFKPFVQMDSSKSRRHQGTGLGLALCKQFVELHKGSIWAESEGEGKGCAFHFVIPV